MSYREPVVFDTDPGIDDFFAMVLLHGSQMFDIKAVTPVAGNQSYDKVANNARDIVEFLGIDAYVTHGAKKPLFIAPENAGAVHGESGLGPLKLPKAKKDFADIFAWDAIYKEAKAADGKLHLIAVGPLTNIAITILKYPDIVNMLGKVTIMGGSATAGNHSAHGEFNIWADPHAAAIVFRSGLRNIKMVGLNAVAQMQIRPEMFKEVTDFDFRVREAVEAVYNFSLGNCERRGFKSYPGMPDAATVAALIDPEIMDFTRCYMDVETKSKTNFGRTVCDINGTWGKEANGEVAMKAYIERYGELLKKCFAFYK